MDDPAVVPGLMAGKSVLRFQYHRRVPTLGKSESRCYADDSAAYHCGPITI
jgi:hypothetical protein